MLIGQLLPLMTPNSIFLRLALPMIFSLATSTQVAGWLRQLLMASVSERLKLYAIGIAGQPQFIPQLIEYMEELVWAPLAAEALASGSTLLSRKNSR